MMVILRGFFYFSIIIICCSKHQLHLRQVYKSVSTHFATWRSVKYIFETICGYIGNNCNAHLNHIILGLDTFFFLMCCLGKSMWCVVKWGSCTSLKIGVMQCVWLNLMSIWIFPGSKARNKIWEKYIFLNSMKNVLG